MMAVEWTLGAWMQPEWRSNAASRRARPEGIASRKGSDRTNQKTWHHERMISISTGHAMHCIEKIGLATTTKPTKQSPQLHWRRSLLF